MSTPSASRASRLRDLLGAAAVAVGVCFTLTAEARPEPAQTPAAPLADRMRDANDSLRRIAPPGAPDSQSGANGGETATDKAGVRWGNYFGNFNPWRNWNNWPNWHNFNQWHNF